MSTEPDQRPARAARWSQHVGKRLLRCLRGILANLAINSCRQANQTMPSAEHLRIAQRQNLIDHARQGARWMV